MSFIKNVNKYYGSKEDVNKLIRYCGNSVSVKNCGFFGVNPLSYIDAIESMYRIKKDLIKKMDNKFYILL